jgi:DegV family protein with EDD domain
LTVAIVTDSAAALPPDLARRYGITVVPMWLSIGGEPVLEGERPLEALLAEDQVTTSAPTPGEWERAIKGGLDRADAVLVLTIAGSMSATYQSALVAAEAVGGAVRVVDTATAAGAEALVVLAAADVAQRGAGLDETEARARLVIERVRLVATLPNLDHLVRGGRVPGIAGWAGRRLGINPLFEFRGGKVHRLRPALSPDAASDRMLGLLRRSRVEGARLHVASLHALDLETAERLLARTEEQFSPATAFVGEFGPVMVVHTGPGLAGLAWWWDEQG